MCLLFKRCQSVLFNTERGGNADVLGWGWYRRKSRSSTCRGGDDGAEPSEPLVAVWLCSFVGCYFSGTCAWPDRNTSGMKLENYKTF